MSQVSEVYKQYLEHVREAHPEVYWKYLEFIEGYRYRI